VLLSKAKMLAGLSKQISKHGLLIRERAGHPPSIITTPLVKARVVFTLIGKLREGAVTPNYCTRREIERLDLIGVLC
jgi:hypothetical protein